MGRYTLHEDRRVDQAVEAHLETIRTVVLRHTRPQALLLAGSFGRGEGSVTPGPDGLRFHSDYEVCLISPSPAARAAVDAIMVELKQCVDVPVSLFWNTPARLWHNRTRNLSFGRPLATIGMYELKAGSQVFYGDFDLRVNAIEATHIPLSEGLRLIENRMMEVVETWRRGEQEGLVFATAKLILACGDALLLQQGVYHYSYAERARRFEVRYEEHLQPILGGAYLEHYRRAARCKLLPGDEADARAVLAALPAVSQASQVILAALLGTPGVSPAQLLPHCAAAMPVLYCTGVWRALDPWYESIILGLRARRAGRKIGWRLFANDGRRLTVFQAMYGAIPALFWGLPLAGEGDPGLLALAARWGSWAQPQGAGAASSEQLAQTLLDYWHILG